jgi:inhibitor of cysteine peptidase
MKKVLLIVLALSLFSCSKENEIDPVLEQNYFEINKNETFEVSLHYAATTGYSWKWIKNQTDKAMDSISVNYVLTDSDPKLIGGGGNEIWKFKGKEKGTYIVTFEKSQPWNANSIVETKKITVKIN